MKKRKNGLKLTAYLLLAPIVLLTACNVKEEAKTVNSTPSEKIASVTNGTTSTLKVNNNLYGDYQEEDYNDDETKVDTKITLKNAEAEISGEGAALKDSILSITKGGNYLLTGEFTGKIQVNTSEVVHLILNNVTLKSSNGPALEITESKKVIVTLAKDSTNEISDTKNETTTEDDEGNSAIYSKADLTFNGTGSLKVSGNSNNAIQSKDDLTFMEGSYEITAVNNALKGKDKVSVLKGTYNITTTEGDAIQTSNSEDEKKGFVAIDGGNFTLQSGSDGVQGETAVYLQNATMKIKTTGKNQDTSYKGVKAGNNLVVLSGTYEINTTDDALHSNGDLTIEGGDMTISSEDDGIHSDNNLTINDGKINILKSYEGLESTNIILNGGDVTVNATDDGVNASAGNKDSTEGNNQFNKNENNNSENADGSGVPENGNGEMPRQRPEGTSNAQGGNGQIPEGRPEGAPQGTPPTGDPGNGGGGMMGGNDGSTLVINGGTLKVNAAGDGLDSNGNITMTDGTVQVYGPTSNGNGTIDYDGTFNLTGGTLLGVGSAGMPQTVSKESTQVNLAFYLDAVTTAKKVTIEQNNKELISFTPEKKFQQIVYTSPDLAKGEVVVHIDDKSYTVTLSDTYNSLTQTGETYAGGMGFSRGGEMPTNNRS